MERNCLDCGEVLQGRKDKKFCNDHCRVNYHNFKHSNEVSQIRSIQQILLGNRAILKSFIEKGVRVTRYAQLLSAGFRFNYHTHILKIGRSLYLCVFEYSMKLSKNGKFVLDKIAAENQE